MTSERFKKGLNIRREVVGAATVDDWLDSAGDMLGPLEELTTEIAWGTLWARPGLDRRTRSLLTLVLLAAQNRVDELETHVQNARNNGCSREEIREALLHTMAYCGVPTARGAIKAAARVLGDAPAD